MTIHLDLQQLSFTYPRQPRPAVSGASMRVSSGELIGLLGPNGSGKSTLLKLVVGPEALGHARAEGQIHIHGQDARATSPRWRAQQLAYLPQGIPGELPFTVEELAHLGRHPHQPRAPWGSPDATGEAAVEDAMRRCDVWRMRRRRCGELSGGERQRALLASVLAQQPKTLLLDEPTSALDIRYALQIVQILRDLVTDQGCAVLLASHDLNMAARFCTRLVVLDQGRLVADGSPDDVLTPELLRRVYGIEADIVRHPRWPGPLVLPQHPAPAQEQP